MSVMSGGRLRLRWLRTPQLCVLSIASVLYLRASGYAQSTICISKSSTGAFGNAGSRTPQSGRGLSADGRIALFTSDASNLVPGDTNAYGDVFCYDTTTDALVRVNLGPGALQSNQSSGACAVSADGGMAVFWSFASNLVTNDLNGITADVFSATTASASVTAISVTPLGVTASGQSDGIELSADGRYMVFSSFAPDVVPVLDQNNRRDVFLRDALAGQSGLVSISTTGIQGNGDSTDPCISADGRFVAFQSLADNLVPNDTNATQDIFVRDIVLGSTSRVSVGSGGIQANGYCSFARISADGRFVAYASWASNLVPGDTNGTGDVFVYDRMTATTERVSVSTSSGQSNAECSIPSISRDGRRVAFQSSGIGLVPGAGGTIGNVYLRDRQIGTTVLISCTPSGTQGNSHSYDPSLSVDGTVVLFTSQATDLVPGDSNLRADVFLRTVPLSTEFRSFCISDGVSADHTTQCPCANDGAPGNGCAHSFDPNGANLSATGTASIDNVVLHSQFEPVASFTLFIQHDALGDAVFHDGVLCASGSLVRLRSRAAVAGSASFPNTAFAQDSTTTLSQRGGVARGAGIRRYYAAWYRNASTTFCPPATANVTNGWIVDW